MFNAILIFIYFFLSSSEIFALPEDRTKVANLSADNADINQSTHVGKYQGHVVFDQGTTHLRAVKAITEFDNNSKLKFACAFGTKTEPVHYWEQIEIEKPILHAYAALIRYYPENNLIVLSGEALIIQGKDSFAAEEIRYDTKKKQVLGHATKGQSVKIKIHPEQKYE